MWDGARSRGDFSMLDGHLKNHRVALHFGHPAGMIMQVSGYRTGKKPEGACGRMTQDQYASLNPR